MLKLCINGDCTGSICLEWGLNECFLTSNIIPNIDKRKLCELACMNGTDSQTCRSTSEFAAAVNLPPGGISLRPGSPCNNFQVYYLFQITSKLQKYLMVYFIFYRVIVMYFSNVERLTLRDH